MYTSLRIVKKLAYAWMYYPNGLDIGFSISKGYITGDEFTGLVQIVEQGKTKRPEVLLQNIVVVDEYTGGSELTFETFYEFENAMVLLNNPLFVDTISGDNETSNRFVAKTGFTIVGDTITINPNWVWVIDGVTYTNPTSVAIQVDFTTGLNTSRLDYIVPNTGNDFTIIRGIETESEPYTPILPAHGLYVTIFNVDNDSIQNAQEQEILLYVEKIESQDFTVNGTGVIQQVNIIDNRSSIVVNSLVTEIQSFQVLPQFIRVGKPFYIKNLGTDLLLKSGTGSGNIQIAEDLVVKSNEIMYLKLSANNLLELVGTNSSNKLDTGTYTGTAEDLYNSITLLQNPDMVLKTGNIVINLLELSIAEGEFEWRINQQEYLNPDPYTTTLVAATENYFRYDIVQGTTNGSYSIKQGVESLSIGTPPNADANCITLKTILLFGTVANEEVIPIATNNPIRSKFKLYHKCTDTDNNLIQLGDLASGWGPGTGTDEEYWALAKYMNYTLDNNTNNHLNYKPISVTLPNS